MAAWQQPAKTIPSIYPVVNTNRSDLYTDGTRPIDEGKPLASSLKFRSFVVS